MDSGVITAIVCSFMGAFACMIAAAKIIKKKLGHIRNFEVTFHIKK
jgi:hypothetical protein